MIQIEAEDCLPFRNKRKSVEVANKIIEEFVSLEQTIISFSNKEKEDKSPLAEYDHAHKYWRAGRYIGEAYVQLPDKKKQYHITITPRFGQPVLYHMLQQIYNIKFTESQSNTIKNNQEHFLDIIIAIIWLKKLGDANRYGLPRVKVKRTYEEAMIKGKLDIRASIIPLRTKEKLISHRYEKTINPTIANILYQTHRYLKNYIGNANKSESAQNAIDNILQTGKRDKVTAYDYKNIKYNAIDNSWRDVVDFSWQILNNKKQSLQQNASDNKSYGFFLDMAEIWEAYIRSVLKKGLKDDGWDLSDEEIFTYQKTFFKRSMIPDIILKKNNSYLVFDAKYKKMKKEMKEDKLDVDRADFYQIHSYIQYFNNEKMNVIAGGLLYPLSKTLENNVSPSLFGQGKDEITFLIDGIEIDGDELKDKDGDKLRGEIENREQKFITSIKTHIQKAEKFKVN